MSAAAFFSESERARLARLSFAPRRQSAGGWQGERRSIRRGASLEFADYRNYAPGDDLRRLDWNLYARLQRPYLKLYEDEEDLALHLIVDASASMEWPPPAEANDGALPSKWQHALRLAAALAYIALQNNDRLTVTALSSAGWRQFGPYRGREKSAALFAFLAGLEASGEMDGNESLREYALRQRRPGLLIWISDLLLPAGHRQGLNELLARGFEVTILHTLDPEELAPRLTGELRLVDIESGAAREISLDARLRQRYEERAREWREGIRRDCHARGVRYLLASTERPWQQLLLRDLRQARLLK